MTGWRIDITFFSSVVMTFPPTLDAVLSYALERQKQPWRCMYIAPRWMNREPVGIPELKNYLEFHDGVPMASTLELDGSVFLEAWRKRFESRHVKHADFGGARRRIDVASGPFRSFNMPLSARSGRTGQWIFLGEGKKVIEALQGQIVGLGKKVSEGFGWISDWKLSETEISASDVLRKRPVPVRVAEKFGIDGNRKIQAWRPPYWDASGFEECVSGT